MAIALGIIGFIVMFFSFAAFGGSADNLAGPGFLLGFVILISGAIVANRNRPKKAE